MSALASRTAMLSGSCWLSSRACWSAPLLRNRHTWLGAEGRSVGGWGRREAGAPQAPGPGTPDSPGVAQQRGVVQGGAAPAVSLVHISPVLQQELAHDQGALRTRDEDEGRTDAGPRVASQARPPSLPGPLRSPAPAHPQHGLHQGRLALVFRISPVDLGPVGQSSGQSREVPGASRAVRQEPRVQLAHVRQGPGLRVSVRIGLSLPAGLVRLCALCGRWEVGSGGGFAGWPRGVRAWGRGRTRTCQSDTFHHGASASQDVRAAVGAAPKSAVAAQTCRAGGRGA